MSHREVEATITVRFRVPSEAGHAQGEHFHFADFPLDATVKEVYEHVGRRILPVELQGELDRVDLLVEAYADGPMIKLQRSTKVPLGKLPFCAGGLCSVECHMPSGFSRARTAAANVSARNQNTGVSYVPSARDEAQSYVQRFVPAAVSFDVQHEVSHEQQQQQRNARADERHISQRGPTVSVAAEEPTKHEEQMVSIGTRNLSAHEQIAQDITVTRSLNAALGREIDSLGEKMAYYTNAQGAMEDRRTALKNELALIRRLLKQSEVDCAQCEQNCDKLHQARNKSQHQSDRSRQSLAVAEKKLQVGLAYVNCIASSSFARQQQQQQQ
eukprot:INCI4042.4.p1 GENE.INCI4042.4~~INCI4042.4.p1  ORF type:complete len:328 (-),score=53.42 INCI4042.4:65-1048(-)